MFLYCVDALSLLIIMVSFFIESLSYRSTSTLWANSRSWVVLSLKWSKYLCVPGSTIEQCREYCFPKKCASWTSNFGFMAIFSEKFIAIYFLLNNSWIRGSVFYICYVRLVHQIATTLLYQCFSNFFDFHLFINTVNTLVAYFYSIFEIGLLLLFEDIKRNFTHIIAFRVFCSVIMWVLVI